MGKKFRFVTPAGTRMHVLFLFLILLIIGTKSYRNPFATPTARKNKDFRAINSRSCAGSLVFDSKECITALIGAGGNKGKLEAILKSRWQKYGLQSLQMTKKALSENEDSDLNKVASAIIDNLSARNVDATTKLLGPTLAENYIISLPRGRNVKSGSSGRSEVIDLYCFMDESTYKGKIVKENYRLEREIHRFCELSGTSPKTIGNKNQRFKRSSSLVSIVDRGSKTLILERGIENLRSFRDRSGPLKGPQMCAVMEAMASSVAQIHRKGQVWCDIKLENFVIVPKRSDCLFPVENALDSVDSAELLKWCSVKAIDLESMTKNDDVMTDFAPETVSPELVAQLSGGVFGTVGSRSKDLKITPPGEVSASQASDVFSLGLSWVELTSTAAKGPLLGSSAGNSFARVGNFISGLDDLGLSGVNNTRVRKLLSKMLEIDPSKRPTMLEVQLRLKLCR